MRLIESLSSHMLWYLLSACKLANLQLDLTCIQIAKAFNQTELLIALRAHVTCKQIRSLANFRKGLTLLCNLTQLRYQSMLGQKAKSYLVLRLSTWIVSSGQSPDKSRKPYHKSTTSMLNSKTFTYMSTTTTLWITSSHSSLSLVGS